MKRIASIIITLILAFSMVTASAQVPKFLTESYNNYTAAYSFTVSFESSDELVALLKELEIPEEVSYFVDMKALLESLFTTGATMNLQANMSDDYRKAQLALTADTLYEVVVNKNLEASIDMKMGMWLKMDLSAQSPVFEIIYSHPFLNKYMVIDVFEMLKSEEEKTLVLDALNAVFNKAYIDSINDFSVELLEKYATISISGANCTVKLDNEGLMGMLGEMLPFIMEKTQSIMPINPVGEAVSIGVIGGVDGPTAIYVSPDGDAEVITAPGWEDLKILGDDGIEFKYSLLSGKVSKAEMIADISVDISNIAEIITGEKWAYKSKGILDFLVKSEVKLSKIGNTKVEFPQLTEENSFGIDDLMPEYEEDYAYEMEYPSYYVWASATRLPVIDGEYYVPLRAVLEDAYYGEVAVEYQSGTVTAQSDYFPGFKTLTISRDSEVAYLDGQAVEISKVIMSDGVTYVGQSFFEELFGWELGDITHYILSDYFEITFYTQTY